MEPGKLFVGGISWDTNEKRLRDYFETFGEVVEAVIMKDRATGRARGFGFVIYADPAIAELVVRHKHIIDGRAVDAKKAVPRDDQLVLPRNPSSPTASPLAIRTKKIFVGGLPSTVTEIDFKRYFDQFGIITDVVVMYDHNTQRPRGFGFITFDSEESVERTLFRKFHELNGKMVEVKRAVPKELSPGPNRSPLGVGNPGLTRVNSFINGFGPGFSPSPILRNGLIPFSPGNYGPGMNYERRISPSYIEPPIMFPKLTYEHGVNGLQASNVSNNPNSSSWSLWGNGNGSVNDIEAIWGSSPLSLQPDARARAPHAASSSFEGEESWSLPSFEFGLGNGVSDALNNPAGLCW